MRGFFLTMILIFLLFLTFLIIFSALKKLKEESQQKIKIPKNLSGKELFNYLTEKLDIKNTYILSKYLNQDYDSIRKLIDNKNYKILNQLIINKYEKQ